MPEELPDLRPIGIDDPYEEWIQWIINVQNYRMEQAGKLMAELMEKALKNDRV